MNLLREIDPDLTNKEIEAIFVYFDLNENQHIKFTLAHECLCRMIQIPAMDEKIELEFKKLKERKSQMSNASNK